MSLVERIKEVKAKAKPTLPIWFAGLDDEDRAAWIDACVDPMISTAELLRLAKEEGDVAVGKDAMLSHRRTHGFAG